MKTLFNYIVHESTPQSKKMKREDENVRGADDESDNEDDDGMTCMTQLCTYAHTYTFKDIYSALTLTVLGQAVNIIQSFNHLT